MTNKAYNRPKLTVFGSIEGLTGFGNKQWGTPGDWSYFFKEINNDDQPYS